MDVQGLYKVYKGIKFPYSLLRTSKFEAHWMLTGGLEAHRFGV